MGDHRHRDLVADMSPPRFSDEELIDILNATRLRSPVMRDIGPEHDRVEIMIPHLSGCSYRFQRNASEWTCLVFMAPGHWKLMASGSLAECLSAFTKRPAL
jgi:hypothetical protein